MNDHAKKMDNVGLTAAAGLFLVAMAILSFRWMQPPDAVPADAPAEKFSSGRALQYLKHVAAKPHPLGSPAHAEVREYIVAELTKLGFQPEIHSTEVVRYRSPMYPRFAAVKNILLRIPGTDNSKALLLLSHYDSVPNAPGATDDGSGVVTMLETLRALKHHPPLKNDLIFLFADGEELGLLGAQAFVKQHPWIDDVGLVLNFEGSGSGGQVLMFETSDQNGWLIEEFAKVAPYPAANSLSYEVYKRMPNDTDLTVFKRAGFSGLNFAYIDSRSDYHTFNDNIENIDERSIQHHGSYALALTRHFGNLSLNETKAENAVYFNTLGNGFIHYSENWVIPLMVLAVVLFALVCFLGLRSGHLNVLAMVRGFLAFLILVATAPVMVASLFGIINKFFHDTEWWLLYYNNKTLLLGFVLLTIAMSTVLFLSFKNGVKVTYGVLYGAGLLLLAYFGGLLNVQLALAVVALAALLGFFFKKGIDTWNFAMGALFGWMIFAVVLSLMIPGGSFLATWPLILTLIPLAILFITKAELMSLKSFALLSLFAIPGIFWLIQWAYLIYVAMGINLSGLPVVFVTLLLSLLIPYLDYLTAKPKWIFSGATAALGFFFIFYVVFTADFNERHTRPNTLFYAFDADTNETFWGSTDRELDEWTSQYFQENADNPSFSQIFPSADVPMHKSPAPKVNIAASQLQIVEDTVENNLRTLKLSIKSPPAAPTLNIFFNPDNRIVDGAINGRKVEGLADLSSNGTSRWWRWRYYGMPEHGIELTLKTEPQSPLQIKLVDISYNLPTLADFKPRPEYMIPRQYTLSDMTVATKSFNIEPKPVSTRK